MKRLVAAFLLALGAVSLSISVAGAAKAAEPTGNIIWVSGVNGAPIVWGGEVVTNSEYEGRVKGNATITISVSCTQDGVEVFSATSAPFGDSSPGVTFGVIFDLVSTSADTTLPGDCVAVLRYTVTKGQSVTVTVLDTEAFTVEAT